MIPAIGGCGTAIPAQGLLHDFLPRLVAVPGKLDYHERTLLWWNCANVADRLTTNRLYLELCCYSLNMPCLRGKKNPKPEPQQPCTPTLTANNKCEIPAAYSSSPPSQLKAALYAGQRSFSSPSLRDSSSFRELVDLHCTVIAIAILVVEIVRMLKPRQSARTTAL